MLKRYAASGHVRWVGKAWEIRRALQTEIRRRGGKTGLAELFPKQHSHMRPFGFHADTKY